MWCINTVFDNYFGKAVIVSFFLFPLFDRCGARGRFLSSAVDHSPTTMIMTMTRPVNVRPSTVLVGPLACSDAPRS